MAAVWKLPGALAVLFVALIGVSYYTYPANQSEKDDTAKICQSMIPPTGANHPRQDGNNPHNSPYWVNFFRWPDGITTLAVVCTLLAIVWQSGEMRRSVSAAQESIALQFRPKLSIRAIKLDISQTLKAKDAPAIWRLVLANVGSSIAYVLPTKITFDSMVMDGEQYTICPLGTEQIEAFPLNPGAIKIISSEITNARDHLRVGKIFSDDPVVGQYIWVRCTGVFVFRDTIEIERRIGFRRRFDIKTGVLLPDSDSEYEFDDET
jgi:hypothetical protein